MKTRATIASLLAGLFFLMPANTLRLSASGRIEEATALQQRVEELQRQSTMQVVARDFTVPVNRRAGSIEPTRQEIAVASTAASKSRGGGDCILHYAFSKEDDTEAVDSSGRNNHGKLRGTGWTRQGVVGGARTFNGKSDYIYRDFDPGSALFPTEGPLSVSAWFQTSSKLPHQQVVVTTHFAGYGRDGYFLAIDGRDRGGKAAWFTGRNEGVVVSKSAVNDGRWHHAVGTWDGKQGALYIDGVLQGWEPSPGPLVYDHKAPFRIGHMENNRAPHARDEIYYFTGAIDEVRIFTRVLSDEDVGQLYRHWRSIVQDRHRTP